MARSETTNDVTTFPSTSFASGMSDSDVEDFLEQKNLDFVTSLTPTIVYLAVLMVVGLVGNTFVVLVYYRRFKPSVTRTYILAMSVCDLTNSVVALPMDVIMIRFYFTFRAAWACKLTWTVICFLVLYSGFLLVAVALDRQSTVCRVQHRAQASAMKVRISLVVGGVVALVLSLPLVILMGRHTVTFPGSNITGVMCNVEDQHMDSLFMFLYGVTKGTVFAICVIIMIVCYGRIGRKLWQHKKLTASKPQREGNETAESSFSSSRHAHHNGPHNEVREEDRVNESEPNYLCRGGNLSTTNTSTETEKEEDAEKISPVKKSSYSLLSFLSKLKSSESRPQPRPTPGSKPATPRHPGGSGKQIPSRTTLMLFVLTAVFIVNFLFHLLISFLREDSPQLLVRGLDTNLAHIFFWSYYINSVVNPFVYSFCSARFRHECRCLLGKAA